MSLLPGNASKTPSHLPASWPFALLILLALVSATWFEFETYPGHSYLQGETQLLAPMLERLDTPGFLSRDLVASNPTFAYTVYDEITQFLHATMHMTFEKALVRQQLLFRFLAMVGVFLSARALKVSPMGSVALSAGVNAITRLAAPAAFVTSPEATPVAFAVSLVLFASGLLMNRQPLPALLAGGTALLYDPLTAAVFWLIVIVVWMADRSLRRLLRPVWPVLVVFSLVLGNLVQLQAGLGSPQEVSGRLSAAMVRLTQIRTGWVWVPLWAKAEIWSYLFLVVAALWAMTTFWERTERLTRWVALGMTLSGLVSVAAAGLLLVGRAQFAVEMPPARNLSLTVAMTVLLCGAAAWHAAKKRRWLQSLPWSAVVLAAILNPQILDLLHSEMSVTPREHPNLEVKALAAWAEQQTWGSSMFQFPDMGKENTPGVFRALSRRALWADWQSGAIACYSDKAGQEWWSRWNSGMLNEYSPARLQGMLPLPIDYYVLRRSNALDGAKPAYLNAAFVVYDAQDLRELRAPLKPVRRANVLR